MGFCTLKLPFSGYKMNGEKKLTYEMVKLKFKMLGKSWWGKIFPVGYRDIFIGEYVDTFVA